MISLLCMLEREAQASHILQIRYDFNFTKLETMARLVSSETLLASKNALSHTLHRQNDISNTQYLY